ncbi:hypothetical protein HGO92_09695 [Arthrobacter sp. SF27]|nr:hypothetical protein [Arthrobacter sp. SF27]NMR29960.1 hypothetical protein [Arthrobacter sp. SF27]
MRHCRGSKYRPSRWLAELRRRLAAVAGPDDPAARGSAVVEFVFLGALLLVPVVYFVIAVAQVQGSSFAVVSAADYAAKVFVAADTPAAAHGQAEQAALLSVQDFGFGPGDLGMAISCGGGACLDPGSTVTVNVSLEVPLPLTSGLDLSFATVTSTATQIVERYG